MAVRLAFTATASDNINIEGIGKVGTANRTLNVPSMTSTVGSIYVSNLGVLSTNSSLSVPTSSETIQLVSKQDDLVIDISGSDKTLSANTLILQATQTLDIDSTITLDAINLTLNSGDSGIVQGGVRLPIIKTDNLTFEVGSDNIIISPESFANLTAKTSGGETTINLVARGNLQSSGTYTGYYKYRDIYTSTTYYLDSADISQATVYDTALTALTQAQKDSLTLAPILSTVSYQERETQSGMYAYFDDTNNNNAFNSSERVYYQESPDSSIVYSRQINQSGNYSSGYYAYSVTENITGAVPVNKIIYTTQSDYNVVAQNANYTDVQVLFTTVNSSLNLKR